MANTCPRCGGRAKKHENGWKCENCGYIFHDETTGENYYKPMKKTDSKEVLVAMRDSNLSDYRPIANFEHGAHYPEIEMHVRDNDAIEDSLKSLEKSGALISEIWDNLVVCPVCESHKLFIQLRCPNCGSGKLRKKSMIQHMSCGHYDFEEEFVKGDKLVCPKCGKLLKALGVDYRRLGYAYKCYNCGANTPTPTIKYVCINGHEFHNDEFGLKELRLYKLNPKKKLMIEELLFNVKPLIDTFTIHGLYVEAPAKLYSSSGIQFEFPFAVWSNENDRKVGKPPIIVVEILISDKPIGVESIFILRAGSMDLGIKNVVILAVPDLDETARALASSYGMHILKAGSLDMLEKKIKDFLENFLNSLKGSN